eukprot:gene9797-biopygen1915
MHAWLWTHREGIGVDRGMATDASRVPISDDPPRRRRGKTLSSDADGDAAGVRSANAAEVNRLRGSWPQTPHPTHPHAVPGRIQNHRETMYLQCVSPCSRERDRGHH